MINTLLVKIQYPNFLSLGTKKSFNDKGYNLIDGAIPIKILSPINDEFVSIKKDNKEQIKNTNDLTKEELERYKNKDSDITFHHKEFKGLNTTTLYDVKDTDMNKIDYDRGPLPALFYSSYDEIYDSFVKALYSDGYKVKYEVMDDKFRLDKDNKIISLKKGLNKQIHLLSILDVYTDDISSNQMEKDLLNMVICRRIGIDKEDISFNEFTDWYKKQDMSNVDHLLKLIVNKGRKFANNFNKFYDMEISKNETLYPDENMGLYDDVSLFL